MAFLPFLASPVDDYPGSVIRPAGTPASEETLPSTDDFEIRRAVAEMMAATTRWQGLGFWTRLIGLAEAKRAKRLAINKQNELRALAQKSPAHHAALRRIVNSMPNTAARKHLTSYL